MSKINYQGLMTQTLMLTRINRMAQPTLTINEIVQKGVEGFIELCRPYNPTVEELDEQVPDLETVLINDSVVNGTFNPD